eukprot:15903-Eustigmatos_ZCMA.PRE.1
MSHAQGTPGVGVLPSSGGPPEHALVLRGLCMDALLLMLRQLYMRCVCRTYKRMCTAHKHDQTDR